ncbi:MAG: glutamate--tRNA ligase family protein [Lentisphaeraceae bacterium]|nr:glutamate--tRNA ligase family protein [Lentisphaeraceae bacterium]
MSEYRGRIAPTPTGYLHLGHARTFLVAQKRALENGGTLIFRNEDLDKARCKKEFITASLKDLKDCDIAWDEGPDVGGPFGPYSQSERLDWYLEVWSKLKGAGFIYPCNKSRKDVQNALSAPHEAQNKEQIFPIEFRPSSEAAKNFDSPGDTNWRFRVPNSVEVSFFDENLGKHSYTTLKDFGDFLVWRRDGMPSYEMAVVADDHAMKISEVVRGEDLLLSTARQLLIYKALNWPTPAFFHCRLVKDENGKRLAKRNKSLSIRSLIDQNKWLETKKGLFS